jgi:hypothetical protein
MISTTARRRCSTWAQFGFPHFRGLEIGRFSFYAHETCHCCENLQPGSLKGLQHDQALEDQGQVTQVTSGEEGIMSNINIYCRVGGRLIHR